MLINQRQEFPHTIDGALTEMNHGEGEGRHRLALDLSPKGAAGLSCVIGIDDRFCPRYFDIYRNMGIEMEAPVVIRALGALAQDHRLAVYRLLVQAGEAGLSAGELASRLEVPSSSLSFHLAQLANAQLVTQRRQSRSIIYSANYTAMNDLMAYLTENCCGGVPCGADVARVPVAGQERPPEAGERAAGR